MRYIILDTETTGLLARGGDRLLEFAGLEMIDRKLTGRNLHLRIHPQRDIPEEASHIHGITLDDLEGAPVFAAVASEIADFIRDATLIIHNAPFDMGFLDMEFQAAGLPTATSLVAEVIDTLKLAKLQFPGKRNNLDALCDRLGVNRSNRVYHGALIDCELLGEVYFAMTRGQENLLMALDSGTAQDSDPLTLRLDSDPRQPRVVRYAQAEELAAHTAYLDDLDKQIKGTCVWRTVPSTGEDGV